VNLPQQRTVVTASVLKKEDPVKRSIVFLLTALLLASPFAVREAAAQDESYLAVANDPTVGAFLTDAEGMTLYLFTKDTEPGTSTCYDQCAENWPPVAPADDLELPAGVPGQLGATERTDGSQQVTYNDIPLYYFAADQAAGDVSGEGVGGVWFVVAPGAEHGPYAPAPGEGTPVPASTLNIGFSEELGPFLTDGDGMTLYLFTNDTTAGESTCEGDCAQNWPPVPAADAMSLPPGIQGELTSIDRADGTAQLAYNGIPLYYYPEDAAPGDITGQGKGDVWFVVASGMMHGDEPVMTAATPASS
jgi:predicted lipoprotein with Yx(FWY)xxD motif